MNKAIIVILSILLTCRLACFSQTWPLITSTELEAPVRLVSLDRFNNIYFNDTRGNVYKLDAQSNPVGRYAPSEYGQLTAIEAWSSLRVFLFYQDTQRYTFLDRFLTFNEFSEFPDDMFSLISLATPTADNQLWLLNPTSLQLTKFDMKFNEITLSQTFSQLFDTLNLEPYALREYQNRVYLGDKNTGILVFDNLGNHLHTIDKTGTDPFHFKDDRLYYLNDGQLYIQELYQPELQVIDLPQEKTYHHALLIDQNIALFTDHLLEIRSYTPR